MSSPQRLDQPGALTISSVLQPVATPGRLRSTPDPSGDDDRQSPIRRHPVVDARPPTAELRPSRGRRSNRCETNVRDSPPGASRFTKRRAEAACPVPSELTRSTRSGSRVRKPPANHLPAMQQPPDLGCGIEPRRWRAALTCRAPAMGPPAEQQIWRLRCY